MTTKKKVVKRVVFKQYDNVKDVFSNISDSSERIKQVARIHGVRVKTMR